jgi:hypothetical protein
MMSWRLEMTRGLALAAALSGALVVGGCSSDDGGGDWLEMLKAAQDSWENRDAPVSMNAAAAIPYATLGVRIDGGREQILLLATDMNGDRLWTSGAHVALTTRDGRIVRTAGLGHDLGAFVVTGGDPKNWTVPHTYTWTGDFAELGYYGVSVRCRLQPAGADPIEIFGKPFDTIRVDENCRSDKIDWTFTNSYWVNPQTGRVWRAVQQVNPKGPVLDIRLLRPPLSPG